MGDRLTEGVLKKQVQRLKTLPRGEDRPWGTDSEPGLREELFKELWRQAESNDEAERIVNQVIALCKFCPSPAELIEIATEMRVSAVTNRTWKNPYSSEDSENCPECHEWGSYGWKERDGVFVRCSQPHGADVPENMWLMLNSKKAVTA